MKPIAVCSLLLHTACATITCDGGVQVTGVTPAKLVMPREADGCVVEAARNGYGRYWANFGWLAGSYIGVGVTTLAFIVDVASGSMYNLEH